MDGFLRHTPSWLLTNSLLAGNGRPAQKRRLFRAKLLGRVSRIHFGWLELKKSMDGPFQHPAKEERP
jgi:hypothetical protein